MALDDTSLVEEVYEILNQGPLPVHYQWTAHITLPDGKGVVEPYRVLGMDNVRDYDVNYCDERFIDVAIGLGTYEQLIIPNQHNLLLTLIRTPMVESGNTENLASLTKTQTFRATLYQPSSGTVAGNTIYSGSLTEGNLVSIKTVTFQLVDLAIEQTRMQSVGTVIRQSTAGDAIHYLVTKVAQSLKVDADHQVKGVDMVPPNNTKIYAHVIVPHGTRAVDVPRYIAHHTGAPYSAGFGAYLQGGIWYLYPLFDLTRYDKAQKTLTILNVPQNRFPQSDRTYRVTANQVIVLATEENRHVDISEALQLSLGNGSRYADATRLMEGFVEVKNNVATAKRVDNVNEYVAQTRDSGYNNVQTSDKRITTNTFAEMGKLAPRLGSLVVASWVNSDPDLIFPGMPVKYVYEVDGQLYELKGQVIKSASQIASVQPGLYPGPHRCTTALTLFVEKALNWNTPDSTAAQANTL